MFGSGDGQGRRGPRPGGTSSDISAKSKSNYRIIRSKKEGVTTMSVGGARGEVDYDRQAANGKKRDAENCR